MSETDFHLHHPAYNPDTLLDVLIDLLEVKTDVGLCARLGILPPTTSMIRHRRLGIGPMLLIFMHEESGLSIKELRLLMGDRCQHFCSIQTKKSRQSPTG